MRVDGPKCDFVRESDTGRARPSGLLALGLLAVLAVDALALGSVTISGTVVGPAGAPVAGTEIRLYTEESFNALQPVGTCATDSGGAYACTAPPDTYWVAAVPPAESWLAFEFYPGGYPGQETYQAIDAATSRDGIDFSLVAGGRVAFDLLASNGEPVDFAVAVHARFQDGTSGIWYDDMAFDSSTGRYESSSLPGGTYLFALVPFGADGYLSQQFYCGTTIEGRATPVEILAGQRIEAAACRLISSEPTGTISGRVTDLEGEPIAGVEVQSMASEFEIVGTTITAADGRYALEVPEGRWLIRAVPPSNALFVTSFYPDSTSWGDAEWVSTGTTGVDLELSRGGRVIFQLTDDQGAPLDFACDVDVVDGFDRDSGSYGWLRTSESGHFSQVLPPGEHAFILSPDPDRPFMTPQGLCAHPDVFNSDRVDVIEGETLDLGSCQLISDRYYPHTSAGSLFAFERDWVVDGDFDYRYGSGWSYGGAAVGDLTGDGLIDIVASGGDGSSCPDGCLAVFINLGEGRFSDRSFQWVPENILNGQREGGGRDIEIADMNCDGFPDLVLGKAPEPWDRLWGDKDSILENDNGGRFLDRTDDWMPDDDLASYGFEDVLAGWFTHSIQVGDLDNDGDLDIVRGTQAEQVLLNDGSGVMSLAPPSTGLDGRVGQDVLYGAWGIDLGDLNGDGVLDAFYTSSYRTDDGSAGFHYILLGRGDGAFLPIPIDRAPRSLGPDVVAYQPLIRDFDGDGNPEVYIANIDWGPENATHGWPGRAPLDQLLRITSMDGQIPTFVDVTGRLVDQVDSMNASWQVRSGDIDLDGDDDIVVSNLAGGEDSYRFPEIRTLLNDGAGSFTTLTQTAYPPILVTPTETLLFDADNDGDVDMFLANNFPAPILLVNLLLETYDLDGDGYVTPADAEEVLARFGTTTEGQPEDINADGTVDARDLSLVLRFQTTVRADNSTLAPACTPVASDAAPRR